MLYKSIFFGHTDNTRIQFFRYLFVGGSAFVVDFSLMWIFVELVKINVILATTMSFCIALTVNYTLSIFWVFTHSNINSRLAEFTIFALIGIVGLGINEIIIALFQFKLATMNLFGSLLNTKDYYIVGKLVATGVVFIWTFSARKLILFSKRKETTLNNKTL